MNSGERLAARHYRLRGYRILAANARAAGHEHDQVELVPGGARVRGQDAVAAEPVVPRREALAAVHAATYARAANERRC